MQIWLMCLQLSLKDESNIKERRIPFNTKHMPFDLLQQHAVGYSGGNMIISFKTGHHISCLLFSFDHMKWSS